MKTKHWILGLMAAALVLVAAAVAVATQNVLAGLLAASLTAYAVEQATGVALVSGEGLALVSPLIGLKRKYQTPQLGGSKRLYFVFTDDIEEEFLDNDLVKAAGEYNLPIPLVAGKKFVEIEAWYDTTKWNTEMNPGQGFKQDIEFEVLGYNKDIVKLMGLLYELPVNVIVEGNDNSLVYLGQKYVPLMFSTTGASPVKGSERKKTTFKAAQDGLTVPAMPLGPLATFAVEPLVAPVTP